MILISQNLWSSLYDITYYFDKIVTFSIVASLVFLFTALLFINSGLSEIILELHFFNISLQIFFKLIHFCLISQSM